MTVQGLWYPYTQCPVGFLCRSALESARKTGGCPRGPPQKQYTACIAVEPVHKLWTFGFAETQRIKHAVKMTLGPAAALDGQSEWLVHHNQAVIHMKHRLPEHVAILISDIQLLAAGGCCLRGCVYDGGGDAHLMSRIQSEPRFDPSAIDANLTGSQQLFERSVTDTGKMPVKPAIKPQPGFFRANLIYACFSHITQLNNCRSLN